MRVRARPILDWIMVRRARRLADRLRPFLPDSGRIADIGSGTGHNSEIFHGVLGPQVTIVPFDVADVHWVGPVPQWFDGERIPVPDGAFASAMLLFVLQYSPCPETLLREASRVADGPVLVLQSSYRGPISGWALRVREFFWGRFAFRVAVTLGALPTMPCPLEPKTYYRRADLVRLAGQAGLEVRVLQPSRWSGLGISRDLLVLTRPRGAN